MVSDASPPLDTFLSSDFFWKEIKACDAKLKKCSDIMTLIARKFKAPQCSETEKKKLKSQLAHTRIMMNKFEQKRTFILKHNLKLSKYRENIEMMKIVQQSNAQLKNIELICSEAQKAVIQNNENSLYLDRLEQIVAQGNEDDEFDKELKKIETELK